MVRVGDENLGKIAQRCLSNYKIYWKRDTISVLLTFMVRGTQQTNSFY
jgi:hypothetical protein